MGRDYGNDYPSGSTETNPSSGLAVIIASFISALLLSLLCGLFYNDWKYEIERIELEEGGWQSRIAGELDSEDMEFIRNYANVKDAVINEKKSKGKGLVVDLYFYRKKTVPEDTLRIAEMTGVLPENIFYHHELLAMYLVRAPGDTEPRPLFPAFIAVTVMASFSLIMIIYHAFAVSMNAKIRQVGILSGIGATPGQIRSYLLREAAALCVLPAFAGNLLGIAGSMGFLQASNVLLGSDVPGRHEAVFGYHPLVFGFTVFAVFITIWISAWLPAGKLSRMNPLEAMKNTNELQLNRKRESRLLSRLFGVEGELAGNALKAQRKIFRTASLSLIFSFTAFSVMQCFFLLSKISTRETYFERYRNVWDLMVTVKDTEIDEFEETEEIQTLAGVKSAVVYQKTVAKRIIAQEEISEEMKAFGGFSHASDNSAVQVQGGWMVNVPLVILDDNSFLAYCKQIGAAPRLDGAVIINQIRDVTNPDFRHPRYMPYIKEEGKGNVPGNSVNGERATSVLRNLVNKERAAEITVLSYTDKVPVLKEEYATIDYYELVHVIPLSLWKEVGNEIKNEIGGAEEDTYIRILGKENVTLEQLNKLQKEIERRIGSRYTLEYANRIQEYETNNLQIAGIMSIFGWLCAMLAAIGIGNVFSNTLGFVRQRKREFARYMSVGLTPNQLRKMFCIEALVTAGGPILIAVPLIVVAVWYMLRVSYLDAGVFLAEAPLAPIFMFMAAVLGAAALAYYCAWRSMRKIDLAEVLKDDTMI